MSDQRDRSDRIEKEIEEILAKLEVGEEEEDSSSGKREPISFEQRRKSRQPKTPPRRSRTISTPSLPITPATLLFAGAGTMIGGLILATFWSPLIWLSFAGVLLFILAFGLSFVRRSPGGAGMGAGRAPKEKYWRGRYIEVEPDTEPTTGERFKRMFRRR